MYVKARKGIQGNKHYYYIYELKICDNPPFDWKNVRKFLVAEVKFSDNLR